MNSDIQYLITHKEDLNWMISGQAAEFDDYLRIPIRDKSCFADSMMGYYKYYWGKRPGTTRQDVANRLGDALTEIGNSGEDLGRLSRWLMSMKDTDNSQVQNLFVRANWESGFKYWNEHGLPAEAKLLVPLATDVIKSYCQEVQLPKILFKDLTGTSETRWLAKETNRSELDNYLFSKYYGEVEIAPSTIFDLYYWAMLQRSWFDRVRKENYSNEMGEELLRLLKIITLDGTLKISKQFIRLVPIEEAFALNAGCLFEDYCRDW